MTLFPQQALQDVRAAGLLLHSHVCAVVPVGGVPVDGVLHPGPAEVHRVAQRHLAGQQRGPHVGEQALRPEHQPQREQVCHFQRHRYEKQTQLSTMIEQDVRLALVLMLAIIIQISSLTYNLQHMTQM